MPEWDRQGWQRSKRLGLSKKLCSSIKSTKIKYLKEQILLFIISKLSLFHYSYSEQPMYFFQAKKAEKTILNKRNISLSLHCLHLLVHLVDYVYRPLQLRDVGPHQVVVYCPDLCIGEVLFHKAVLPYFQNEFCLPLFLAWRLGLQFLQLFHQHLTTLISGGGCHHIQPWRFLVLIPIAQDRLDALLLPGRLLLEKFLVDLLPCRAKTVFKMIAGFWWWKLILFDSTFFLLIFLCFIYSCVLCFESDT